MPDTMHPSHITLQAFVESALEEKDRLQVEAHLDGCSRCRVRAEETRDLIRALETLPDLPTPFNLTPAVLALIEKAERRRSALRIALPVVEALAAGALLWFATGYINPGLDAMRAEFYEALEWLRQIPTQLAAPVAIPRVGAARWIQGSLPGWRALTFPQSWLPAGVGASAVFWFAGNWVLLRRRGESERRVVR